MKVAFLIVIVGLVLPALPGWAARVRHFGDRRVEALNQQQLDKARGIGTAHPAPQPPLPPMMPMMPVTPPILGAPLMEPGMSPGAGAK